MADEVEKPSWMLGAGVDVDMTGDPTAGAGAFIRFWLPKGSDRTVVFLTEGNKSVCLWEHNYRMGGNWRNWLSCCGPTGAKCPMCAWADANDGQFRRYKAQFFTIVDCHEFTDSAGKVRKNEKRLLCAKKDTTEVLKRKYLTRVENDQGLRGAMFKVYRTSSDKSAGCGEDFEFQKMVDLSSLPDSAELDYVSLLRPQPEKMLSVMDRIKRESGSGGPSAGGTDGSDARIPF